MFAARGFDERDRPSRHRAPLAAKHTGRPAPRPRDRPRLDPSQSRFTRRRHDTARSRTAGVPRVPLAITVPGQNTAAARHSSETRSPRPGSRPPTTMRNIVSRFLSAARAPAPAFWRGKRASTRRRHARRLDRLAAASSGVGTRGPTSTSKPRSATRSGDYLGAAVMAILDELARGCAGAAPLRRERFDIAFEHPPFLVAAKRGRRRRIRGRSKPGSG